MMFDQNQIPQMDASQLVDPLTLYRQQNGMATPPIDIQRASMGLPVGSQIPIGGQPQSPELQHVADVASQYMQNKTQQQSGNDFLTQILSNRMQPTAQDTSRSLLNSALTNSYSSPEQETAGRYTAQLSPYSDILGLQGKISQSNLQNAQAGYYNDALARDIAEKRFEYENDPAKAQAKMMAQYMASLGGMTPPQPMRTSGSIPIGGGASIGPSTPQNLPQAFQQNAQQQPPQGGGFNPMGAMLAKSLGLTDMQIGPNGQPMPIPGSMKIENGSVISFDQNGIPQSNTPVNPRAQGLFEQKLQNIKDNVDRLHAIGGTVEENPDKGILTNVPVIGGFLENKATQIAASQGTKYTPGGQDLLQGTQAQTLRDNIQADVKQALPLYMQAFGITPGMERAQAAQQMLQDAIGGAVGKSRQHLLANLKNLSQTAGTGDLARKMSLVTVMSPTGQQGTIDPSELSAALQNGWKQVP